MSYTPPGNDSTDFQLEDPYTPPGNDSTDFQLGDETAVSESGTVTSTSSPSLTETGLAAESSTKQATVTHATTETGLAVEAGAVLAHSSPDSIETTGFIELGSVSATTKVSSSETGLADENGLVQSQASMLLTETGLATENSTLQSTSLFSAVESGLVAESPFLVTSVSTPSVIEVGVADETSLVETSSSMVGNMSVAQSRNVNSYVGTITSFASSERTSLQLIDFDVSYDESTATWVTDWFQEERILGDEETLALIAYTVDGAKDPAATVYVEYDASGDGNIDERSEAIPVDERGRVRAVEDVPSDEEGYYRLLITEYSGYNSLTNLNIGLVH